MVTIYNRRVRTDTITVSSYTHRLYARTYWWGYRPGSTAPEWFRGESV